MKNFAKRSNARRSDCIRSVKISFNTFGYAAGSVLFEMGNTKVLCSVNMNHGVPPFLKGKRVGWLTSEYAMLPSSTTSRSMRESSAVRRNGRSVEISRFIGRSLRTMVDFSLLGERTIVVDCDVLQADGSTRTACITGASLALRVAVDTWLRKKKLRENILKDHIAAVSVGVVDEVPLLDLDFSEDSKADADFNFVITRSNKLVEIQGASEGAIITWDQFDAAKTLSITGTRQLFDVCDSSFNQLMLANAPKKPDNIGKPLFSLGNRQNVSVR